MSKAEEVRRDFEAWSLTIPKVELTRPWGFEIEAPQGWVVTEIPDGIEAEHDGSVDSHSHDAPDCECSCDECDHSCDCGRCDISSGWGSVDHCGETGSCVRNYNEFKADGPCYDSYPLGLVELSEALAGSEQNSTAGVHVHVEAKDLNCLQVSRVLRIYRTLQWLMTPIAGREDTRYAGYLNTPQAESDIDEFYARGQKLPREERFWGGDRYQVVNTQALYKHGTLEFRQMACNFNAEEIASWGRLQRALVSAVKNDMRPFEVESVETLADYIRVLSRYTTV